MKNTGKCLNNSRFDVIIYKNIKEITMKMYKYPKIGQFRNVVKAIKSQWCFQRLDDDGSPVYLPEHSVDFPTITFEGQVKLHGTNAAIGYDKLNDTVWCQSRSRILSSTSDNAGFWSWVNSPERLEVIKNNFMSRKVADDEFLVVYGEWCGGSIQKGVALNELEQMFVIFDAKIVNKDDPEQTEYQTGFNLKENDMGIYHIAQFPTFSIDIDFNDPLSAQNTLIEHTNDVEKECPVGKYFDVSGVGEGIVWKAPNPKTGEPLRFKVKGQKHSSSKVKKLAEVDPVKLASVTKFVDYALTKNRLEQAIEVVFNENNRELDMKHTGDFVKWIDRDIFTEEQDVLLENDLTPNDVVKEINYKAVNWLKGKIFGDL